MTHKYILITLGIALVFIAGFVFYKTLGYGRVVSVDVGSFVSDQNSDNYDTGTGTMIFVGDIMLSRAVGDSMEKRGDYNFPFYNIREYLKSADLTFGNLESPISSRGVRVGSIYSFRGDPRVVEGLTGAGFDVVSIANNHIWDYGRDAFVDTLSHLREAGIEPVGGGSNFKEAHAGVSKNINGAEIIFLAYTNLISKNVSAGVDTPGVSYLDQGQMIEDIQNAKNRSDLVVVSFHWGEEYQTKHNLNQEQIAKTVIDAGASLIIGHHPHVVQEVEQYRDGWIAYSLGNFIFDQNFSQETMRGLALEVSITNKKITTVIPKDVAISREYQASLLEDN